MGSIQSKGRLIFNSFQKKEFIAQYKGEVSQYGVHNSDQIRSRKNVMKIKSKEIIQLQELYISSKGSCEYKEQLKISGMSDYEMQKILYNDKPLQYITLQCLSGHAVSNQLALRTQFEAGDTLFEYGLLVAECHIAEQYASLISPGAQAFIRPVEWRSGVNDIHAVVRDMRISQYGNHLKCVVVEPVSAMYNYRLYTEVCVFIGLPDREEHYNCQKYSTETDANNKSGYYENIKIPNIRMRGIEGGHLSLHAGRNRNKNADDSDRNSQRWIPQVFNPVIADLDPLVEHPISSEMPRFKLATLWSKAQIKTVTISRWTKPLLRIPGRIGTAEQLGLHAQSIVEDMSERAHQKALHSRSYVELSVNKDQFKQISNNIVTATMYNSTGAVPIDSIPQGYHEDKLRNIVVFGLRLPSDVTIKNSDLDPWVDITDANAKPKIVIPRKAVHEVGPGLGRILAHIARGTLAILPVQVHSLVGCYVEISDEYLENLSLVHDIDTTIMHLRLSFKGKREEGKLEKFLESLKAAR